EYSDPVATYQRWRDRMAGGAEKGAEKGAGKGVEPGLRDLASSSRDEGAIVAGHLETAVAGADPPGPVLRPDGVSGEVVTGPLRTREAADKNVYTIAAGDTLYGIAVQHYGDAKRVDAIAKANPGLDPNRLRVGDRIVLPDPETEKAAGAPPTPKRDKVYVVQRNDTLIGIARRIYGDAALYPRLYEANKDVLSSLNARLYVGMRLRMPEPE
ncbi:MAG: LysM peptidoglycan-binding domain-containing protein, partial [Planctomycetes bacterium]|nr:LysM peptidoglycan-binding domain-containing protein [Planctomycetota bacterium]